MERLGAISAPHRHFTEEGPMDSDEPSAATGEEARTGPSSNRAMLVAFGIDALGNGLFLPLSLLYFTVVAHLPLADVGLVLSAATACSLVVPLVAGTCADRFGARRVVVASQLLQAVGFCGYLFVHSIVTLCAAALLVVAGERAFWTTVFTFVAETADGRQLDRWYARVSVTRSLGSGGGSLIAGLALGTNSPLLYRLAIGANAVSFVVAAVLLGLVVGESRPVAARAKAAATGGGYREVLRDRPFLAFTLTNVVYSVCLTIINVALPVYLVKGLKGPGWLVGVLFALNTGLIIVAQTRVTKAVGRHRRTRVLAAAGALWVVWALTLAAGPRIPHGVLAGWLIAGMLVYTVAEMMQSPTSTSIAAAASVTELRGRYMAIYQYGYQIAKIIAPVLFTQLFLVGTALPWLVLAVLTACVIPAVLKLEGHLPVRAIRQQAAKDDEADLTRT